MKTITAAPLTPEQLLLLDRYWRAANYLSVGEIFLRDNPLLERPLIREDVKPRMIGHWGTTPGLNLLYTHLNRLIVARGADVLLVVGPGHGGPGLLANAYLEGTYSEVYPEVGAGAAGLKRLFTHFAWPGGTGSHAAPEIPGSIHEGGELGYSLAHAYGAVLDSPNLLAVCLIGDGEAETGPLAAAWHSNKFLNPSRDGAVLPVLHLNGYKIANPTVLSRISDAELTALMTGYGYEPILVSGEEPAAMHQAMAAALDACADSITAIQGAARAGKAAQRPSWPMIVLRTPKGWTGPKEIDGQPVENTCRAHAFRMNDMERPGRLELLEAWLRSYQPRELFDEIGRLRPELSALCPSGARRMSANPHANGGILRELAIPEFTKYKLDIPRPGAVDAESTKVQGRFIRDLLRDNGENFRIFSPDETVSNGWGAVYEVDQNCFMAEIKPLDLNVSPEGRVMEVLSEHLCQGWLEGYLLTGRHGFFNCYEGFIEIVTSMSHQYCKWLDVAHRVPWRKPLASLNYLLSSHVWRQDHNGFSHLAPGFIDHLMNMKPESVRVHLAPDANTLLCVTDECLRTSNRVNVIIAGKQVAPQWLSMEQAVSHCAAGLGAWDWASTDGGRAPDVVMAACGDVPTMETLAAVSLLRARVPELRIRMINVVDLMKLRPWQEYPNGLTDEAFLELFTPDKPVVFAFHGYPGLIHRLAHLRPNGRNILARGFKEEGTTSTPFDTLVRNELDRWRLALDAIERVPRLAAQAAELHQELRGKLSEHRRYIEQRGEDLPEIRSWRWDGGTPAEKAAAAPRLA
ncbi:MAG: phosphoketolase family protein [Elusimicrobia bacterium]|nr:phosphoketolase family protein [Elusimicrobiota bacterium]